MFKLYPAKRLAISKEISSFGERVNSFTMGLETQKGVGTLAIEQAKTNKVQKNTVLSIFILKYD